MSGREDGRHRADKRESKTRTRWWQRRRIKRSNVRAEAKGKHALRVRSPLYHQTRGKTTWIRHFAICCCYGRSCLTEPTTCNCRHSREGVYHEAKGEGLDCLVQGIAKTCWQMVPYQHLRNQDVYHAREHKNTYFGIQPTILYARRTTKSDSRLVKGQSIAQVRTMTIKNKQNKEPRQQSLGTHPPKRNSD